MQKASQFKKIVWQTNNISDYSPNKYGLLTSTLAKITPLSSPVVSSNVPHTIANSVVKRLNLDTLAPTIGVVKKPGTSVTNIESSIRGVEKVSEDKGALHVMMSR